MMIYNKMNFYIWVYSRMKGKYLLLGTNLGDRFANLEQAKDLIIKEVGDIINHWSAFLSQPGYHN